MLDVTLIRTQPEYARTALAERAVHVDIDAFLSLDHELRDVRRDVEWLRGERNSISDGIARRRHAGEAVEELRARAKALRHLGEAEQRLRELQKAHRVFLDRLPN